MVDKRDFNSEDLECLIWYFFQENCSLLIDQLRGQRPQKLVALARAQEHNLEYTSFHSGNSIR